MPEEEKIMQEISTTVYGLLNNINDEQIKNEVKKYENKIILFTYYFENIIYINTIKSEYKSISLNLSIIMISDYKV